MDEIIKKATELGQTIAQSELMKNYIQKEIIYEADATAQELTQKYNKSREEFAEKAKSENITPMELIEIRKHLAKEFEDVKKNHVISEYLAAKSEMENMLEKVNGIIKYYVTGEEISEEGCSGNCSSCGGCH